MKERDVEVSHRTKERIRLVESQVTHRESEREREKGTETERETDREEDSYHIHVCAHALKCRKVFW